jgi:outer membrane receptor protein involved in Fe transport
VTGLVTAGLLALAMAAPGDSTRTSATPDSTAETPRPGPAVRLQELVVRASRLHDPLSSQTVHVVPTDLLRQLPFDRVTEVLGTQAGVVAQGEELHVRGGRAGETQVLLHGVGLNEPRRGVPLELPSLAVREVELATGGLDADLGGGLAGAVVYRTQEPGERPAAELVWKTDGQLSTHYDQVGARLATPLPAGMGLVASGEATLDDTHLPMLRTESREQVLGGSFGWRAQNRMLGHAKLTASPGASRLALEVIANRRVTRPYDPMWSLDGYTTPCDDPLCAEGPVYSPTPQPGYSRYRAPDHLAMTDERGSAAVLAWTHAGGPTVMRAATGWRHASSVTSLNGQDDAAYLVPERFPEFGLTESPKSQPFYVYRGDEPFFSRSASDQWTVRADAQHTTRRGGVLKGGLGVLYDHAELREIDYTVHSPGVDSLRGYRIWAPGGYAFVQGRWIFEGLVAHGGLRLECFDPGPQAASQAFPSDQRAQWSLSPRLGVAYPVSVRDVFSLSYLRMVQNPERDFLYDARTATTNQQPIGRPDLEPATMISYQAAVKHIFDDLWSLQAAVFFRDLFGQVGARDVSPQNDVPQLHYRDQEDASVSGVETSLRRASPEMFFEFHYTYLEAQGTASAEDGIPYGSNLERRAEDITQHALDWDRRHTFQLLFHREWPRVGSIAWASYVGSGLPWTPRARRQAVSDPALENTERLKWEENTSVAVRGFLPWTDRVAFGLEIRNLFDYRSEVAVTTDGYPNPRINTLFDDYGAFRTETGRGGGAYWNDRDGDGIPGWIPVHDPRLFAPPRTVRMMLNLRW